MASVTKSKAQAFPVKDGKDATRLLAKHAATLPFEAIPQHILELAKQSLLDTLGVIIGASKLAPEARIVGGYAMEMGGKPESTVLGFGGKLPAPWAVFCNGSLGHMLDYDDVGGGHVGVATVPVAFALAEKYGGIHGRDLLSALVVGADIHGRLEMAVSIPDWHVAEGWFATQLLGYISGAATGGRVLKLTPEQMENALGIGFNQLSGSYQMAVGESSHMRSMQAGFSGHGAVMAADLAQRGIIGSKDVIEGRYGFFRTYVRTETPWWDELLGELDTRFPLPKIHYFKIWPACGHTRPVNESIARLREEHALKPEEVESITIIGGTGGTGLLSNPLESKRRPLSSIDGKFSIPFTAGAMMAHGNVTLSDYSDTGLRQPEVLAMADRVSHRADPAVSAKSKYPIVEVRTKDGRVLRHQCDNLKHPVTWASLEAKFRDCVSHSEKPIPAANVDRVIALVRELEKTQDATEVMRLLG